MQNKQMNIFNYLPVEEIYNLADQGWVFEINNGVITGASFEPQAAEEDMEYLQSEHEDPQAA